MSYKPAAPPRLIAPLDGAPVDGPAAIFQWEAAPDGAEYEVQVAADPAFVDRWFEGKIGRTDTFTLLETLPADDTTFYWRVRQAGGEWSGAAAFRASDDEQVTFHAEALAPARDVQRSRRARENAENVALSEASGPVPAADEPVVPPYLSAATGPGEAAALVAVFLLMMVLMGLIAVMVGF